MKYKKISKTKQTFLTFVGSGSDSLVFLFLRALSTGVRLEGSSIENVEPISSSSYIDK